MLGGGELERRYVPTATVWTIFRAFFFFETLDLLCEDLLEDYAGDLQSQDSDRKGCDANGDHRKET